MDSDSSDDERRTMNVFGLLDNHPNLNLRRLLKYDYDDEKKKTYSMLLSSLSNCLNVLRKDS